VEEQFSRPWREKFSENKSPILAQSAGLADWSCMSLKPTERFSNRAADYRLHRPGYPAAVAEMMRDRCGLPTGAAVADVAAGTGLFTKVLVEGGFEVTAIEPNAAMRAACDEDLGGFPNYHSISAPAEETGLPDASVDAITVAQAIHWFDHARARREFARILRPGGWLFIVRNRRVEDGGPFVTDYEAMMRTIGPKYNAVSSTTSEERNRMTRDFFAPSPVEVASFENPQSLDWAALRGRFLSMSCIPLEGQAGHAEMLEYLHSLFEKHAVDGQVSFAQVTEVHFGRLGDFSADKKSVL
jgi:ubiquinone/menaquinone biosynthesis C-methylase UbiE